MPKTNDTHNRATRVEAEHISQGVPWSPELFCGRARSINRLMLQQKSIDALGGRCIEGHRTDPTTTEEDRAAMLRQLHIHPMQLKPAREHWQTPKESDERCARSGDIVVNKATPIQAALVTNAILGHKVDGNCIVIRGLNEIYSVWCTFCLNQPEYESYLLIMSGGSIIRRVGLKTLQQLRLPCPPDEFKDLAPAFVAWANEGYELSRDFFALLEEVEIHSYEAYREAYQKIGEIRLKDGAFFPSTSLNNENWIPDAIELLHEQNTLLRDYAWQSIRYLTLDERSSRKRLTEAPKSGYVLRLGDVGEELFVGSFGNAIPGQMGRVFAKELEAGEVLLSLLATSPRVAFVDNSLDTKVYVTDYWARFRFRETPAAWALLLQTWPIQNQIHRMGLGTSQQFTNHESLSSLLLPPTSREKRKDWAERLEQHHSKMRRQHRKGNELWEAGLRAYTRVHGLPETQTIERSLR